MGQSAKPTMAGEMKRNPAPRLRCSRVRNRRFTGQGVQFRQDKTVAALEWSRVCWWLRVPVRTRRADGDARNYRL